MLKSIVSSKSNIVISLAAVLVIGVTARLGLWQLDRAQQKLDAGAKIAAQQAQTWRGVWLSEQTLYLDNRQMDGRQGFFVFTPLQLSPSQSVLVQRGWIARDFTDRKRLQAIETPTGEVQITGLNVALTKTTITTQNTSEYPIVQQIDTTLPIVQQQGVASEGLKRNWHKPQTDASKNHGYAFQWFALCALASILYAWFLLKIWRHKQAQSIKSL